MYFFIFIFNQIKWNSQRINCSKRERKEIVYMNTSFEDDFHGYNMANTNDRICGEYL